MLMEPDIRLGETNELDGNDDETYIIVASVIPLAIAYIALGLRIWGRRRVDAKIGTDDWLVVGGLVCRDFFHMESPSVGKERK